MPIKDLRKSTFGPMAELDDIREFLPEIAIAIDALVVAVAAARAEKAMAKATGGPSLLTFVTHGLRVTMSSNGHAG